MSVALVGRENIDAPWSHVAAVTDSDVRVNALSVDALFALYERTGFLYPAKAARLAPHVDLVRENWRRLLQAGGSLLYVLSAGGDADRGLASIAVWRTTRQGWMWQHLVSGGNPLRSRTVMLGGLTRCARLGIGESQQNWFRPENRFPSRVFGSMVESVGEASSSVRRHMFLAVPRRPVSHRVHGLRIVAYDRSHHDALCALATRARGRVYVTAEELDRDVELQSIDCLYREVGLRRTRHVWLAYGGRSDLPMGAAIAYRGPLGLNFSFLENRCDLLLAPGLSAPEVAQASAALMNASLAAYSDFELDEIPVVADQEAMPALRTLGAQFLRNYCHGIWLKTGHPMLYRHVDHFYARLLKRAERRSVPPALTA